MPTKRFQSHSPASLDCNKLGGGSCVGEGENVGEMKGEYLVEKVYLTLK